MNITILPSTKLMLEEHERSARIRPGRSLGPFGGQWVSLDAHIYIHMYIYIFIYLHIYMMYIDGYLVIHGEYD